MLHAARVRAPADPLALAARLVDRPGLSVLASSEPSRSRGRHSYVGFEPIGATASLDPLEGAEAAPRGDLASAPRFVGVLPYEALRVERPAWAPAEARPSPLVDRVEWLELGAVLRVDHAAGEVLAIASSEREAAALAALVEGASTRDVEIELEATDDEPLALHRARIEHAIELVVAGDLYQVNLARCIELALRGPGGAPPDAASFLTLFGRLAAAAPTPFGALLTLGSGARLLSTSPELCLDAWPDRSRRRFAALVTEPIKGTRPRDPEPARDAALAAELDADPKERAELAMIVDVERNDLARVCVPGSVRVDGAPVVETFRTVHHRVARILGEARPDASRSDVLRAMLPSGSVTGAPKVRAMEVIASLERRRRGLYTGALGYLAHDGGLRLSMAIRTAVFDASGRGEYLVGGGVVADSDPAREVEETRWKAAQIRAIARSADAPSSM